jgi:hypothetical protein
MPRSRKVCVQRREEGLHLCIGRAIGEFGWQYELLLYITIEDTPWCIRSKKNLEINHEEHFLHSMRNKST